MTIRFPIGVDRPGLALAQPVQQMQVRRTPFTSELRAASERNGRIVEGASQSRHDLCLDRLVAFARLRLSLTRSNHTVPYAGVIGQHLREVETTLGGPHDFVPNIDRDIEGGFPLCQQLLDLVLRIGLERYYLNSVGEVLAKEN